MKIPIISSAPSCCRQGVGRDLTWEQIVPGATASCTKCGTAYVAELIHGRLFWMPANDPQVGGNGGP
jgi:hypothetical protein